MRDVRHRFDAGSYLFPPLSFTATSGDLIGVVGPSGSGKSTLLSIVAGWTDPSRGDVVREHLSSITWVPQNPFGVGPRSVLDHAALPLLAAGQTRARADAEALEALALFGLGHTAHRPYAALSGGEGQRLMLARATLSRAELVLVDEPTAQLDMTSGAAVIDVLRHLAAEGRIVMIATHDPRVAEACARVIDLGLGQ